MGSINTAHEHKSHLSLLEHNTRHLMGVEGGLLTLMPFLFICQLVTGEERKERIEGTFN